MTMSPTADDFLVLNLEWTEEALRIQTDHRKALQQARNEMKQQLRKPDADGEKITSQFLDSMRMLEEDRKQKRKVCDAKYIDKIKQLQQEL